jgi:hypothetical protein
MEDMLRNYYIKKAIKEKRKQLQPQLSRNLEHDQETKTKKICGVEGAEILTKAKKTYSKKL